MKRVVFDIEANGFLGSVDTIWCLTIKDLATGGRSTYSDHSKSSHVFPLKMGLKLLERCEVLIGHNIILYDMLVLEKLHPEYDFSNCKLVDTLVLSQLQNFNRPLRHTWGKHGLDSWGKHFERFKPEQEVWDKFEEHMIHRCEEDVEINYLTYKYLVKENKEIGMPKDVVAREMHTAIVSQQQVKNGWKLDFDTAIEHINTLDEKMKELSESIEPHLPQRLIKPSAAMTWEEVNKKLGYVFKRVPGNRHDSKDRLIKPAKEPNVFRVTKAGCYPSTVATWFGIEPDNAKKTKKKNGRVYNASLVEGPYTKIKWEVSRMSQHEQVKKFLFTQGWVPTTWNFKKDPDGNFIKDSVGRKVRSTPKLTEDSFDTIKGTLGRQIADFNTYSSRRKTIANVDDDTKGWLHSLNRKGRLICYPRTIGAATARMTHSGVVNVPGTKSLFGNSSSI